jgi:hypothetical protein
MPVAHYLLFPSHRYLQKPILLETSEQIFTKKRLSIFDIQLHFNLCSFSVISPISTLHSQYMISESLCLGTISLKLIYECRNGFSTKRAQQLSKNIFWNDKLKQTSIKLGIKIAFLFCEYFKIYK